MIICVHKYTYECVRACEREKSLLINAKHGLDYFSMVKVENCYF